MTTSFLNLEFRLTAKWRWPVAVTGLLLFSCSSAHGSIHSPGILKSGEQWISIDLQRGLRGDALSSGADASPSSKSKPSARDELPENDSSEPDLNALPVPFTSQGSSSGGSGSSSSSAGGSAGSMSVLAPACLSLPGLSPTSRLATERALSLLEAPTADLLRPPQI